MSKRILYFTDLHLRMSNPRLRVDNLLEEQFKKLEWIFKKAEQLDASIVFGGDFGDSFDWRLSLLNRTIEVLKKSKVDPIYCIIGNHDVPGRNVSLIGDTGLGTLHKLGYLKIMNGPTKIGNYIIHPFHSDTQPTEEFINSKYEAKLDDRFVNIAVVHAPVGKVTTPFCKGHKDLVITGFNHALFGDIHDGWDPYHSLTDCIISNPGSISRLTKGDAYRTPMVALIEDKGIAYWKVPCNPVNEAFNVKLIKEMDKPLGNSFLKAIKKKEKEESTDPIDIVKTVGEAGKFSTDAIELLVRELS